MEGEPRPRSGFEVIGGIAMNLAQFDQRELTDLELACKARLDDATADYQIVRDIREGRYGAGELPPLDPEKPGRFESPRDRVLYELAKRGWANDTCGHPDGPLGFWAWAANSEHELRDLLMALDDGEDGSVMDQAGLLDVRELVGFWLLHENGTTLVTVYSFDSEDELRAQYGVQERAIRRATSE